MVGGGPAGCHTAIAAAKYSNQNLNILLMDRNSRSEFGKKTITGWSCGDAVSKGSVDYIRENLGVSYQYPELEHYVKGVVAYSPDHQTPVLFEGDGYVLNRKLWPQKQLEACEKFGVQVKFQVAARNLIVEDGSVVGVEAINQADHSIVRETARVVIDASGCASVLRVTLPIRSHIQREIDRDDLVAIRRYILEFDHGGEDRTFFDPDVCIIHLDQYLAPGGYAWTFPKGKNKVNIGLGVQKKSLDRRNTRFGEGDSLKSLVDTYVRSNTVIENARLAKGTEDRGNEDNAWQCSVRRPNDCLVANGYAIVGDAAWMPRPIDAGGIGPSLYASVILGRVVAEAVEAGDVSERGLWRYNLDYMRGYGSQMASFEVLRRFLQNLSNDEISYGMRHFLSYEDVEKITKREHPKFSKIKLLNPFMLLRVATHWGVANGLRYTVRKHEALQELYNQYPESPYEFPGWHKQLTRELNEAYVRFP